MSVALIRPVTHSVTVSASASPLANGKARALYLGTTGDVTITYANGESDTLQNLAAGVWHPLEFTHLTALGNGAADAHVGY